MSTIHDKLAEVRKLYPDDIERIDAEVERVNKLLEEQEYYLLPATQVILALCRKDILTARIKLATTRDLSDDVRAGLWHIIDAREWFLRLVAKDYDAELANIERQLEADLSV